MPGHDSSAFSRSSGRLARRRPAVPPTASLPLVLHSQWGQESQLKLLVPICFRTLSHSFKMGESRQAGPGGASRRASPFHHERRCEAAALAAAALRAGLSGAPPDCFRLSHQFVSLRESEPEIGPDAPCFVELVVLGRRCHLSSTCPAAVWLPLTAEKLRPLPRRNSRGAAVRLCWSKACNRSGAETCPAQV
jgi:hypothetical protein